MNPEISKLFDRLAEIDETLDWLEPTKNERLDQWIYYCESRDIVYLTIRRISKNINPKIPDPYASMSRDEILGGIGQYENTRYYCS